MGAAVATVISQYISALGTFGYYFFQYPQLKVRKSDIKWNKSNFKSILSLSGFTCIQQSVMNFGILMVQGLVNSFGTTVMAAFAVAVKIDTLLICRFRTLEMHFLCLWHKIMELRKRKE